MKYYKMIYDYEKDDNYINCSIGNIVDMSEYVTSNGSYIEEWKVPVFQYNSTEGDVMSDYIANVYRWLIVSDTFSKYINETTVKSHIQYLPVKILDTFGNEENKSYKVANLLDLVDALDLEHSTYDVFELEDEKIISVEKYALKATEVQEFDIFRLKGDTIPIFVSEKVKKIIEENTLSGFAFLEVAVC